MFGMLSVMAELQRELIVANTNDGLASARARGHVGGRACVLSEQTVNTSSQPVETQHYRSQAATNTA
ncbi:recombinase family protein [Streptomyces sp. NPDC057539]|uniref:recombinase family protein n=1 Tax=Streptomyces sp. NPDC057539 TaxID=3346159 RepID=UPI0036CA3586